MIDIDRVMQANDGLMSNQGKVGDVHVRLHHIVAM
jgi:hypothetical protein